MKKLVLAFCFAFMAVAAFVFTGCETESVANNDLNITPVSIGLHDGEYADFTASGGFDYNWSLQNPSWGVLSDLTGPTTRYTDRYDPGSNGNGSAVQVLTVTSTIQGANPSSNGVSTTNGTTSYSGTATAQIEHLPTNAGTTNTGSTISISPSSASLSFGSATVFEASGGSGSYSWSLDPTYADLTELSTTQVKVTSTYDPGSNSVSQVLSATDSEGLVGTASITFIH